MNGSSRIFVVLCLQFAATAAMTHDVHGDIGKDSPLDVRVMTYNVKQNFITDSARDAAFDRVLTALEPDIIVFEEIPTSLSSAQISTRLGSVLSGTWEIHFGLAPSGFRNIIASRFPLSMERTDTDPAAGQRGVTIALADLPDGTYPRDLYLLGVHLKCCGEPADVAQRQVSADAIAAWLGDARQAGGEVALPSNTPMIVLGDFNLVSGAQPGLTLLTGNIIDEFTYGADVKGDWDVTDITDLIPLNPYTGDDDTWISDTTNPSSRLDGFMYTDSVVQVSKSLILNTLTLPAAELAAAGLQADDTTSGETSDHLPLVMDLRFFQADCNGNGVDDATDIAGATSVDCNLNGFPDECDLSFQYSSDCNSNGTLDECDIAGPTSNDCNLNGVPDECEFAGLDCNSNGVEDDCDLAGPTSVDCNQSGVPDECEATLPDCNSNGTADLCDILALTSPDCNVNDVPDECELGPLDCDNSGVPDECELSGNDCNGNDVLDSCDIAGPTSADCNRNDLPDECDIAGATSEDCNGNSIPDECDLRAAFTSFEEPGVAGANPITDSTTGTHTLVSGAGELPTQYTAGSNSPGMELGFAAVWTQTRGNTGGPVVVGSDADDRIGVTDVDHGPNFTDGSFGYSFEDCDGRVTLTLDAVTLSGGAAGVSVDVFVAATTWENDDVLKIIAADGSTTVTLIDTTGSDMDLLGTITEGAWRTYSGDLTGLTSATLTVEVDSDAGPERITIDNVVFTQNDCNDSGVPDECELAGNDCDSNEVPDECDPDCNTNGVADACDIAGPTSADCDSNGTPDECEPDCNANGVADACDIAGPTSDDCNTNGVPDECEPVSSDCNDNGVDDLCDIGGETSEDCNGNSVPDECDLVGSSPAVPLPSIDFTGFTGTGFTPTPAAGQLDSDLWAMTGWSNGNLAFGGTQTTANTDYTRGASAGGVGTGGVYAFDVDTGAGVNPSLGFQPGGSDWAPGTVTLRLTNDSCTTLTGYDLSYNVYVRNDQARSNSFNFAYSSDNVTYTPVPALDLTSPAAADVSPTWVVTPKSTTITGLSIASGAFYYLRWSGADIGGSGNRDEFALDDIVLDNPTGDGCGGGAPTSEDCNSNSIPDECDIAGPTSVDCDTDVVPDECEGPGADCNNNGVNDDCDIDAATSDDCNTNGLPDECDLAGVTSDDCNSNGIPDDCDIAGGASLDCNTSGVPDECEPTGPDCNNNNIPDVCDLFFGSSDDCNNDLVPDDCQLAGNDCDSNNVPDECQLAFGDCNSNGLPDGCDIAGPTSVDCDTNGVPDECEVTAATDCNANGVLDVCDIEGVTSADCNGNHIPDECDIAAATSNDCNTNAVPDECDLIADFTSFEEPGVPGAGRITDSTAGTHVLVSGPGESATQYVAGGNPPGQELGFVATWTDTRAEGAGPVTPAGDTSDRIGVTGVPPTGNPFTHGDFGYAFEDTDGRVTLTLDAVPLSSTMTEVRVDVFVAATGWEIDDLLSITVNDGSTTLALIDTTGQDIDNLGIEGMWMTLSAPLTGLSGSATLTVRVDNNAGDEVVWIEHVRFMHNDCNANSVPDDCEPDCNTNGFADDCDITGGTSTDADTNGVPDECDADFPDCNSNGVNDALDIAGPTSGDCNSNGVPDECDIAGVTSMDCNSDETPDECELDTNDCNTNGTPDDCETFDDCNTNLTPDECELDTDGDGTIDDCDECPANPDKIVPGVCGCDNLGADIDADGDRDADDLTAFVQVLMLTPLNPAHVARCDQNDDGVADGDDAQLFVMCLVSPS